MSKSKRIWRAALSMVLVVCLFAGVVPAGYAVEPPTLTVGSYNIAGNKAIPSDLLAGDMKAKNVDVVGMQEVDKLTGRNNHDVPVEIANELGSEFKQFFGKSIDLSGGEYGNAIVSRYDFKETDRNLFADNGYERRSWVKVVIEVEGKSVAIYNTHLSYENLKVRHDQIVELLKIVDADPTPYKVITGDFNTDQFNAEFYPFLYNYNLANGHNNQWIDTYAESDSSMRTNAIDNIITTRNMKLVDVGTYYREEGQRSDHKMLYATYQLLDEEVSSTQLLDLRIQEAQNLLAQGDVYTPETLSALKTALKQAVEGAKDTQSQINALVRPLEQAITNLEKDAKPVAYYNFDDGSTHDLVANSHGVDKGSTAYVDSFSSQAGKALDTTNGYVSIPKVNDAFRWGTRDASIAFWFKSSDYKNEGWILGDKDFNSGANPGFGVCYYYDRVYSSFAELGRHRTEQQNPNTLDYIKDGKWHHIVATLDRDGQSLFYVDGKQVADAVTNPKSTGNATTDLPFCIGADVNGKYGIAAQFDELKIYDVVLTPDQVIKSAELPHVHKMTEVKEKAPTCTEAGNSAYWYCADCGKYFKDQACTEEIAREDTVIAAIGHKYEHGVCTVCGAKDPDYVDKTQLEQAIANAESMIPNQEQYVPGNWQQLVDALDAAMKVMENKEATEADVKTAADALTNAMAAQKLKADKTALKDLVAEANDMKLEGYTAESVENFKAALEAAKEVLVDETLTKKDQAIVDEAVAKLYEAVKGLTTENTPVDPEKPDPTEPEKPEPTDPDVKPEPPKTGDNSGMMLWATVAMLSLAGAAYAAVALTNSHKRKTR